MALGVLCCRIAGSFSSRIAGSFSTAIMAGSLLFQKNRALRRGLPALLIGLMKALSSATQVAADSGPVRCSTLIFPNDAVVFRSFGEIGPEWLPDGTRCNG